MTRAGRDEIAAVITAAIERDQDRQRIAADEIRDSVSRRSMTADEWFESMLTSHTVH